MSRVMGKRFESRIAPHQPARNQIDGQRKPIHLNKQRHDEGRESAKRAPIPLCLRFCEAESENDEDCRVDDDKRPQSVRRRLFHLPSSKTSWISGDLYAAHPHCHALRARHEANAGADKATAEHTVRHPEDAPCVLPKGKRERSRQILETQDQSATLTSQQNRFFL